MQHHEKAIVVGIRSGRMSSAEARESMMELTALVDSAGADIVDELYCDLAKITPATFIGNGKVEELRKISPDDLSFIAFDEALSPAQQRNLENRCGKRVIDRTGIILDIFAQRARTKEGKIQVELAQLQYLLPRLTRMWRHLDRLGAGIGTRGPGETQLEVDRRKIRHKINKLREELKKVRKRRRLQRHGRRRSGLTTVALVGYTNAGKSTLLNRLTAANAFAADMLFATLDPTIRSMDLPNNRQLILSDTVGFIKKLPHQLVEAFRATLEEVTEADLLIHVVNAAAETRNEQITAVQSVLNDLKASQKPTILVLNKSDLLNVPQSVQEQTKGYLSTVFVSALNGDGCLDLIRELVKFEESLTISLHFHFPYLRNDLIAGIQGEADIMAIEYLPEGVDITARIHTSMRGKYEDYIQKENRINAD